MGAIKNYLIIALSVILVVFIVFGYVTHSKNNQLKNDWIQSENNYKASNRKNLSYQLTIEQMKLSQDSNDIKLLEFKDRLRLKDSKISALMRIIEIGVKKDTIEFRDTLFVKDLKIDTIIGDKWIKTRLQLEYPKTIIKTDSIYNIKNIA